MFSDLKNKIRKTNIVNSFYKFRRNIFSKKRKNVLMVGNITLKSIFTLKFLKILRPAISKKFSLIALISVVSVVAIFILIKFLAIKVETFLDEQQKKEPLFSESFAVEVLCYVEENGYYYIPCASVITIDSKQNISFGINTYLSTDEGNPTLMNILNSSSDPAAKIQDLTTYVEAITGLDVDRYILINLKNAEANYSGFNISELKFELTDGDDSELDWIDLNRYVFDINLTSSDSLTGVQSEFVSKFTQKYLSQRYWPEYFFEPKKLRETFKTNLTKYELLKFSSAISSGYDRQDFIRLEETTRTSQEERSSLLPNRILLDEKIRDVHKDIRVLAEQAEVEVYNASATGGLASYKTRVLNNKGTNVVKFGNYSGTLEENTIFVDSEEDLARYKNTINLIRNIMDDDIEIKIGEYKFNQTGDLVLVLAK